jgi:hypothetical protein
MVIMLVHSQLIICVIQVLLFFVSFFKSGFGSSNQQTMDVAISLQTGAKR